MVDLNDTVIDASDKYDISRLSFLSEEARPVMLFIDAEVPQYDVAAGYFIINEYLKIFLKNGYKILYWPFNRIRTEPYTEEMQKMGIEVIYGDVPFQDFIEKTGRYVDVSIVCRPEIAASYMDSILAASKCKIIYFAHDLHFLRQSRQAEVESSEEAMAKALATKVEELGAMRKADISLLLSSSETSVVNSEDPKIKTATIPWIQGLNIKDYSGFDARRDIVFLGGFLHAPNVDAAKWFHDTVYPFIREADASIRVSIIGSHIPPEISDLHSGDFRVPGFVKNLDEYLNQARVFVAPMRFGAGIKGKIAMAESYGLPVVTTSIGAEGMGLVDGETALIADDPREFAEKVVRVYQDKGLWEKVSANAIQHVIDNFSPEAAEGVIMDIIANLDRPHSKSVIRGIRRRISRFRQRIS